MNEQEQTPQQPQGVGLIGGMAVGATVYYYQAIVEACSKLGFSPRLLIAHANVEQVLSMVGAGQVALLAKYLAGFVHDLEAAGVGFAAIGAVAPHLCLEDLLAQTKLPLVDLIGETRREIEARGLQRVTLFGTRTSIETRLFGGLQVEVVLPKPDEITLIHETYLAIARAQRGTPEQINRLRSLAQSLCAREDLDAVVLAGTDLSLVFHSENTDFPAVDCARVHINAIVNRLLASH